MPITIRFSEATNSLFASNKATAQDIEILLRDALSDFRNARERGDPRSYVAKRYPELYGDRFEKKVAEVNRRLRIAALLNTLEVEISE